MKAGEFIARVPVPVCGLSLAFASLDRFLWYTFPDVYTINICAFISFIIAALFTIRIFADHRGIMNDLRSPAVFAVLPTYTMTLMLLSAFVKDHIGGLAGDAAFCVWISAVIMSFVIMILFVRRFFFSFDIRNVFPSWIIIFVGYVVASLTSPSFGAENIGRILFWCGFAGYLMMLPLTAYRIFKVRIPEPLVPQTAIFAAPANLCAAGCLASYSGHLDGMAEAAFMILAVLGIISYIVILICLPVMLKRKFHPSFAAVTFPLAISAVSFYRIGKHYGFSGSMFDFLSGFTIGIAVAIAAYVLIRYVIFLTAPPRGQAETNAS